MPCCSLVRCSRCKWKRASLTVRYSRLFSRTSVGRSKIRSTEVASGRVRSTDASSIRRMSVVLTEPSSSRSDPSDKVHRRIATRVRYFPGRIMDGWRLSACRFPFISITRLAGNYTWLPSALPEKVLRHWEKSKWFEARGQRSIAEQLNLDWRERGRENGDFVQSSEEK
jgi:hypothetical protein